VVAVQDVITVPIEEPGEAPSETVMLKMTTGNPDIVVYWLMDDQDKGD
jgi:hypothetical protein